MYSLTPEEEFSHQPAQLILALKIKNTANILLQCLAGHSNIKNNQLVFERSSQWGSTTTEFWFRDAKRAFIFLKIMLIAVDKLSKLSACEPKEEPLISTSRTMYLRIEEHR